MAAARNALRDELALTALVVQQGAELPALRATVAQQAAALARQDAALARQDAALARQDAALAELLPLRALLPAREPLLELSAAKVAQHNKRFNFISALICTAQNGYARDVDPFVALCRETWREEQLWDALKDLPHGRLKQHGPRNKDGAAVVDPYGKKRTRLMHAARKGDGARVRWLLARGARAALQDVNGRSALYWACLVSSSVDVVRALLAGGAPVDAKDRDGFSPLCLASGKGHVEVVRALLAGGADVEAAANDGATPLFIASEEDHVEVVRVLLAGGAAVDAVADGGRTPLYTASDMGHVEVVHALLAGGADVEAAANDSATPLFIASQDGHVEVVRALLAGGAAVDAAVIEGATPLIIASQNGHVEVVRTLLAGGAAVNHIAANGATPLSRARAESHAAVVALLLAAGAA